MASINCIFKRKFFIIFVTVLLCNNILAQSSEHDIQVERPTNLEINEGECTLQTADQTDTKGFIAKAEETAKHLLDEAKKKIGVKVDADNSSKSSEAKQCNYYQCVFQKMGILEENEIPNPDRLKKWISDNVPQIEEILYERTDKCFNELLIDYQPGAVTSPTISDRIADMGSKAADKISELGHTIREKGAPVVESAQEMWKNVTDKASEVAHKVKDYFKGEGVVGTRNVNPRFKRFIATKNSKLESAQQITNTSLNAAQNIVGMSLNAFTAAVSALQQAALQAIETIPNIQLPAPSLPSIPGIPIIGFKTTAMTKTGIRSRRSAEDDGKTVFTMQQLTSEAEERCKFTSKLMSCLSNEGKCVIFKYP